MDEGSLNEQIGICLLSLGDYQSACSHLEESLRVDQHGQVRQGVVRRTYLATTYVRQGEPVRAAIALSSSFAELLRSMVQTFAEALMGDAGPGRYLPAVMSGPGRIARWR
jgi:hypothetical protein